MAKKTEKQRIAAIPGKDMKAAILSMNGYLKEKEADLVVFEKVSKTEALANLLTPITAAIEAGEAETLPDEVISFYNDHMVVEEAPTETPKKDKPKKEKKEKAPRKPSNEQATFNMVKAGKTDADIKKHFAGVYAGKDKDDAFIAKRAGIYTNIAKRKLAGEDPAFAKRWEAEKETLKPKKEKKEKVPKKESAKESAKDTAKGAGTTAQAAPKKKVAPKKTAGKGKK